METISRDKIIEILKKPRSFYIISCTCKQPCSCTMDYEAYKKADEIVELCYQVAKEIMQEMAATKPCSICGAKPGVQRMMDDRNR